MMTSLFDTYRVGAVHDEPLEQDASDLLLDHLRLGLGEQVQQHAAEVVRVLVGVPELVRHRVEEEVAALGVELIGQLLSRHFSGIDGSRSRRRYGTGGRNKPARDERDKTRHRDGKSRGQREMSVSASQGAYNAGLRP